MVSFLSLLDLLFVNDPSRIALPLEKIEPLCEQDAQWLVIKAALITTSKDYKYAGEIAKELLKLPDSSKSALVNPVWELASLLAHEHSQYQAALELLEPWRDISDSQSQSYNELTYTLKGLLFYCYAKSKRYGEAKALLDEAVSSFVGDPNISSSNPGYADYQVFQSRQTAAQKYLEIQAPFEALQLARTLRLDQKTRAGAARWTGSADMVERQLEQIENQAIKAIDATALETAIGKLIKQPATDSAESLAAYPAFLLVPSFVREKDGSPRTTCVLSEVLQTRRSSKLDAERMEKLGAELFMLPTKDVPVLGLITLICLADTLDKPDHVLRLAEELKARVQHAPDTPLPAELDQAVAPAGGDQTAAPSDPLSMARAALIKDEQAAVWLVVDRLKRRGEKEMSLHFAEGATAAEGADAAKSPAQIAIQLELIRLKMELGRSDSIENELRGVVDALFPPATAPTPIPK